MRQFSETGPGVAAAVEDIAAQPVQASGAAAVVPASGAVPSISVVSTMYRSRGFLDAFLSETLAALQRIGCTDFEIVLVNDGSPDDSLDYAIERRRDIPQLVVVDLTRNFGHHRAMLAGLGQTRGDLVFLIDCDLEVAPSTLAGFYARQRETGADVVFGFQEARKGGWFERVSGGIFWKGFNLLSETKVTENLVTERIMTRRFVDALLRLGDTNVFIAGMMSWTGYRQIAMPVPKSQRQGQSTYSLLKRVQLMVDAISSFSSRPLVWLFNAGVAITAVSFGYAAYLVLRKFLYGDTLLGFTSVMALMAISLGILTTAVGMVGIYLGKVFNQVQNRPPYLIRDIHR
jgi:putative glycosyltransferase